MRLAPVAPSEMSDEQRSRHEAMVPGLHVRLNGYVSKHEDGALSGPFASTIARPAAALLSGPVPNPTWARAVDVLGEDAGAELVHLVRGYCSLSELLDGVVVPVPGERM